MRRPPISNRKGVSKYEKMSAGCTITGQVPECSFRDIYIACRDWLLEREQGARAQYDRNNRTRIKP
jgi:hypothetical protein